CDRCCTTISPGRPRLRCPAITSPPMMCRTASASHTGHGTDSRSNTPAPQLRLSFDRCGGTPCEPKAGIPARDVLVEAFQQVMAYAAKGDPSDKTRKGPARGY